jgi:hypothetical protein
MQGAIPDQGRERSLPFIAWVRNPGSTNAHDLSDLASLVQWDCELGVIETSPDRAKTIQHLQSGIIPPDSIVCARGGDGVVSLVGNAMLSEGAPPNLREATLMVATRGRKNDFGRMVNKRRTPYKLLTTGKVRDFHPFEYSFTPASGIEEDEAKGFAMYSIGLGVTALVAERINSDEHRAAQENRGRIAKQIAEYKLVAKAIFEAQPLQTAAGPVQDLLFSNGNRVAGQNWFRDVNIFADKFVEASTGTSRLMQGANAISRLLGVGLGKRRRGDYEAVIELTGNETVMALDGETIRLKGPGTLRVRRTAHSLRILSY